MDLRPAEQEGRRAGHGGGIRGLRRLLTEHGEAIASDVIDRGMRLRDIGKPWFSWADLKAIVMRAFSDPMSELHRKLNPDWRLQTPEVRLLSEIATIQSSSRYWQVAKILNGQDVPQTYWETRYGLPAEEVDEVDNAAESADAAARARAVANEIMAG